jgi:hypothetical protein
MITKFARPDFELFTKPSAFKNGQLTIIRTLKKGKSRRGPEKNT